MATTKWTGKEWRLRGGTGSVVNLTRRKNGQPDPDKNAFTIVPDGNQYVVEELRPGDMKAEWKGLRFTRHGSAALGAAVADIVNGDSEKQVGQKAESANTAAGNQQDVQYLESNEFMLNVAGVRERGRLQLFRVRGTTPNKDWLSIKYTVQGTNPDGAGGAGSEN